MNERRPERIDSTRATLGALALYTAGGLFWAFLPFFIGLQTETGQLTPAQAGRLGTSYLLGFTLVSVGALWWAARVSLRAVAGVSALMVAAALLAMGALEAYAAKILVVALIGVAMGALWTIAYRIFGASANPDRSFAIGIVVSYSALAAVTWLMSAWVIPAGGLGAAAAVLAALVAVLAAGVLGIPRGTAREPSSTATQLSFRPPAGVSLALIGIVTTALAYAAVWAFAERIGVTAGFEREAIGPVLAFNLLATAAGSLLATVAGGRLGRRAALYLGLGAMGASVVALGSHDAYAVYAVGLTGLGFGIGFVLPFQMATLATLDAGGRFVVLITAAQGLGSAAGPFLGGIAAGMGGYDALVWFALAALVASAAAFAGLRAREPAPPAH